MFFLTGKNLGERHRELNFRVIEAASKHVNLDEITHGENYDDINKLFQIDLASKYKNFDFILETLKSGNNLYITRALKCAWIYEDAHANIINPTYLHNNLFPYMSQRMKLKMLTTISMHIRNEDRVICFYSYCMNAKLNKLALKFLVYTPEIFKLDLINNDNDFDNCVDDEKYLKQFIGNSLTLAMAYVEMTWKKHRRDVVHQLRFLYSEFDEDFLDMLEKYVSIKGNSVQRLGKRISRDILKRHKNRVWNRPSFYTNKLHKSVFAKCLTMSDVKDLAKLLLPDTATNFWSMDFYHSYEFILNLIPFIERFTYLKAIFSCAYGDKPFEMDVQFCILKYYKMFTIEERESWAMQHIENEAELFGSGNDYLWYGFIAFDKALEGIKQYVFITPDNDKRLEIINVLIDSARTQEDLMKLFNYYYDRHVNESDEDKRSFIDLVIEKHDMFTFTEDCWIPFHKLLYSLEVYDSYNTRCELAKYFIKSLAYHILNDKELPKQLENFIKDLRAFYLYDDCIMALPEVIRKAVIKYWLEFHAKKMEMLLEKPIDDKIQEDIYDHVTCIWHIIWCYNRDEKECPESVLSYMRSNMDVYQHHPAFKEKFMATTEEDFVRFLKKDKDLTVDAISKIMCNSYRWSFRLNRLFRKLKVYFSNDVSKEYLEYFLDSLEWLKEYPRQYRNIKMAVVGVFLLGPEETKISILEKYAPQNRKIDHANIDRYLLQVQKAICYLSYQSQPPIQLTAFLKYLKGDYVRFCLPIFNNYVMNLPIPCVVQFINKIIDSPLSIQKHALRMAFECFSSQDVVNVTQNIWNKTKNVSLRMLLYKKLFSKMVKECGNSQSILYSALKTFTLGLNHQDHESIFDLFQSDEIPEEFIGDYLQTIWQVVNTFSNKTNNLIRKANIIRLMKNNIKLLVPKFLREKIIDEHVRTILLENTLKFYYSSLELEDAIRAKWDLTITYIVIGNYDRKRRTENEKLLKDILTKCLQMWNYKYKGLYTYRKFCNDFLNTLHEDSCATCSHYMNNYLLYQSILEILKTSLPKDELYLPIWKLEMSILSRKAMLKHYHEHNGCLQFKYPCTIEIAEEFAKNVGILVKELVKKKMFYYSFYLEMSNVLINVCKIMDRHMRTQFGILTSGYLTQFKIIETHVLAVMLMPKDPPKYWEKRHKNVLDLIKKYDSEEIRTRITYKFLTSSNIRHIL